MLARARLFFKGSNTFKFSKDYEDILASIFLNKINKFIETEPLFKNFNFFTFSYFIIEQAEEHGTYTISENGIVSVVISSISEEFLRKFIAFLVNGNNLHLKNNTLSLFKFDIFEEVSFDLNESNFITVAPILLKDFPKDVNLFVFLENLLINNYCAYYKLENNTVYCEITTNGDKFQKFIDYKNNFHYYMLDIVIRGDKGLLSFAYDVGLGEDTHKGCGMLDLY